MTCDFRWRNYSLNLPLSPLWGTSLPTKAYVKPRPTNKHQRWIYGEVIGRPAPRSCLVSTAMGPVRRNHAQIREAKAEPAVGNYDEKLDRLETASLPSESGQTEEMVSCWTKSLHRHLTVQQENADFPHDSTTSLWNEHFNDFLAEM